MCACGRSASASLEARASNIRYCLLRLGLAGGEGLSQLIFWLTDSGVRGRFLGLATLCRCTLQAVAHACPTLESSLQPLQLSRGEWWRTVSSDISDRRTARVAGRYEQDKETKSEALLLLS